MNSSPPSPHTLRVPALETPERLDKFLVKQFPHTSRAFWRGRLPSWVRVDGRPAGKGTTLRGGETLSLSQVPVPGKPAPKPNPHIKLRILYEDPHLLAVDKPAGLPCLPLREEDSNTVVQGLLAQYPEQAQVNPESEEAGLFNRLDNETSGILLFARHPEAMVRLALLNREGGIQKEYQAWVTGRVERGGLLRSPIAHHPKNKRKMVLAKDEAEAKKLKARPALTQYQVIKAGDKFSLLRVGIQKGNRHQIRVHLAGLGHPVVGDALYGEENGTGSHLLHATEVRFRHPFTGKNLKITSPLPEAFHPKKISRKEP